MKKTLALLLLTAFCLVGTAIGQDNDRYERHIKRVLLISIDGMHAVDFENCAKGISTINNGDPIARHLPPWEEPALTTLRPALPSLPIRSPA